MIEKQVKISDIKRNPANPRIIRDEKYSKLLNSLLVFPKMLQARPIVVDKQMVVLGGNMRLKALQEIATFDNDELYARLSKINEWKEKDKSEQTEIFDFWLDFATTKKLNIAVADDFSDKEASAFIIKDNNNYGDWDYDLLNNWDSDLLEDWGVECIEEDTNIVDFDFTPPSTSIKGTSSVRLSDKEGFVFRLGNRTHFIDENHRLYKYTKELSQIMDDFEREELEEILCVILKKYTSLGR